MQEDAATYSRAQPVATDAALKQSSKVLKYSFGFLSFALLGGAIGGGPFCFNPPRAVPHACECVCSSSRSCENIPVAFWNACLSIHTRRLDVMLC